MRKKVVRLLFPWFSFLTCLGLAGSLLTGCGSVTQSKSERLVLQLGVPAGEDPSLFWFGVTKKTLRIGGEHGDPTTVPWQEGQTPELSLREGDKIEFIGSDTSDRVLVSGEARVGGEKSLTIPLRRVL